MIPETPLCGHHINVSSGLWKGLSMLPTVQPRGAVLDGSRGTWTSEAQQPESPSREELADINHCISGPSTYQAAGVDEMCPKRNPFQIEITVATGWHHCSS